MSMTRPHLHLAFFPAISCRQLNSLLHEGHENFTACVWAMDATLK
jgi:hypothetical protein